VINTAAVRNAATSDSSPVHADRTQSESMLLAILPRGEAIRNFVYTGALDRVAQSGRVSVLSVLPSPQIEDLLCSRYGSVVELKSITDRWFVRIQTELLDMAHGRWLWSEAARERWRIRDFEAAITGTRTKRWLKKLACFPFANKTGLGFLSWLECYSSRVLRSEETYVELLRSLKPSLVFNGSHVHSRIANPAVKAARWLGIPTAAFIFSWDNLTSQGRIVPNYDFYLVWNQSIREQLLRIYPAVDPARVIVTGSPQFDFHFRPDFFWSRREFCHRVGADPDRPIVLYSTGMPNHMPGEERIVERIGDVLRSMRGTGQPQLLVRVYPKDQTGRFEDLRRRRPDILFQQVPWQSKWLTPEPVDSYLWTNTLRHTAVGINVASTVSLELCMFDKPVINIGYNPPGVDIRPIDYRRYYEFDHYRPVVESGAVDVAQSETDLRRMLDLALIEPERSSKTRRALLRTMFGETLDGRSAHRVAAQLVALAAGDIAECMGAGAFQ
jgi:hypothetical protein